MLREKYPIRLVRLSAEIDEIGTTNKGLETLVDGKKA
jgi:hypothetical protein